VGEGASPVWDPRERGSAEEIRRPHILAGGCSTLSSLNRRGVTEVAPRRSFRTVTKVTQEPPRTSSRTPAGAGEIVIGAENYADGILNTLEINLSKFTAAGERGRARHARKTRRPRVGELGRGR